MIPNIAPVVRPAATSSAGAVRLPGGTVVATSATQALPNPRLRLDGALGMVVIEFRNTAGEIANSIPTQRQMDAYRAVARGGDPQAPRDGAPATQPGKAPSPKPAPTAARLA